MVLETGAKLIFLVIIYAIVLFPTLSTSLIGSSSSSSTADVLFIRHGRSRVRHSNEKDHIRWGLKAFDNLTLDYDATEGYENDTMILFGSDFWAFGDNGSYFNQTDSSSQSSKPSRSYDERSSSSTHFTTPIPTIFTTTIKKKLTKKKIMENIRKNVDKGLEYLKQHKNLQEDDITIRNDASSVAQRSSNAEERVFQNDGFFFPTSKTSGTIMTTFGDAAYHPDHPDSYSNENQQFSAPTRISAAVSSHRAAIASLDGDTINNENIEKTLGTINLGYDIQDENSSLISDNQMNGNKLPSPISIADGHGIGHVNGADRSRAIIGNIDGGISSGSISSIGEIDVNQPNENPEAELDDNSDDESGGSDDGIASNVYGTTNEDLTDLDEISRNNRLNLMKGRDVVTRFLQIVESQHLLGANCTAGTALNLGEGVVDQYAQDRFRIEAEVAVNRANMLTRIFKLTSPSVQASEHLLHASVLSMVEFDDDIFAAGNCFDWNQHPSKKGLFCPFAYRLPPPDQGASFAKDLAAEYHYLGNTSEWFFLARKNAEKVIARNEQYIKAYHLYSNSTSREADEILSVKYEDGRWSKPYYDCGGGNIWMLTYTVPFFGYENGTYFFKGTSGIDIDLRRVDIDQCPQRYNPETTQPLNIFAGTDKCKQRTTMCEAITGLGFRRGSYKCVCRKGFYYPDTAAVQKYFNGSILEEEYEKLMLGEESTYSKQLTYECLPCAEGCDYCEDASPCVAALNWPMRTSILVLACAVIGLLPPAAWFTFRYQQVKVVRAASPALLRVIALGAFFIYCTTIVMYPPPSLYTCTARIWLREIGFSLTYGALMLKTWRISVIFRVRSAKAVKITDAALLKRLGVICGAIGACLLVRTIVAPPEVVVGRTADDLKAFLCKTDWWDYTFTSMEVLFLAWGVRLCIMVRKAPSEFNESRFISMAIYNEFLLTCFLNVSMLFLQSPANPDLLYIIFFCHTQLTVTLLLGLIFGSKVYIVLRSGKSQENAIGLGAKSSGAKFNFRPQIRTFANPSTATSSTAQLADTKLSEQEALEELRQLSYQLQRIQELAPPRGVAVMTISSILDGLRTTSSQLSVKPPSKMAQPVLAMNNDLKQYQKSIHPVVPKAEKSVNTNLTGDTFWTQIDPEYKKLANSIQHSSTQIVISDRDYYPENAPLSCRQSQNTVGHSSAQVKAASFDLSFSDLKLKCMCSDEDALAAAGSDKPDSNPSNCEHYDHHSSIDRFTSCNKTFDNHPYDRKFHSSCNLIQAKASNVNVCDNHKSIDHFLICDNCKKKIVNTKSIEINLDSRLLIDNMAVSHDDISFHSTDDCDDDTNDCDQDDEIIDRDSENCPNKSSSVNENSEQHLNSNSANGMKRGRNRKTDKLVLDLNDRSKYTKEVSV